LGISKHDVVVDRHHTTPFARFDYLGIAQLSVGNTLRMRGWASRSPPWRLIPFSIHMQQGGTVFQQLIAGKKGDEVRGHICDPLQQQIGFSLRALAGDKGHDQPPFWGKGYPNPGIAIRVTVGFRPREMLVFRMDKAPEFVQLALSDGQLLPQKKHDEPTRLSSTIEPSTYSILINLDDPRRCPDRITFCQGANGQFKQRRVMLQIKIGCSVCQGDATPTSATPSLALSPRGPILDQPALAKAHAVKRTDRIWTI
jgi:hypothetical protein